MRGIPRLRCWPQPRLLDCSQGAVQPVVALCDLLKLRMGSCQRLLVLAHDPSHIPVASCLQPVLKNDNEEQATEQAQRDQVPPEIAFPDALIEQPSTPHIQALAVVIIGWIHVLQSE